MKAKNLFIPSLILILGIAFALGSEANISEYRPIAPHENDLQDSTRAFDIMMDVLTHQRCMNCHPNNNIPKQGDDRHPHYFGIKRGEENMGFEATNCHTCHQSSNNLHSGVPGAPHWSLAPASMGWEGLSRTEIAAQLLNTGKNGGRNSEELIEHMTEDELVLWAWEPGVNAEGVPREPPPISKEIYIAAVKKWFEEGHVISDK